MATGVMLSSASAAEICHASAGRDDLLRQTEKMYRSSVSSVTGKDGETNGTMGMRSLTSIALLLR